MARFRKIGGGNFRIKRGSGTEVYRKGDVFEGEAKEIPEAFRDQWIRVDEPTPEEKAAEEGTPNVSLKLVQRSPGWYDVINSVTGEPINDSALRKDDALALMPEEPEEEDDDSEEEAIDSEDE